MTLSIVDFGCSNLGSVAIALERFGVSARVTSDPGAIAEADKLILPGVGAAGYAMTQIRELGLAQVLRDFSRPALGICLGMQLLFEGSEEGDTECLGLIGGRVRRLRPEPDRPVPHMGWSRLKAADETLGVQDGDYVYFAHSYACDDGPATLVSADYGRTIPAVVHAGNWWGAQFHPERSGAAGERFLSAFLAL